MKNYKFILAFALCIGSLGSLTAATFSGRVVDEKGAPIAYATVYPEIAPEWGTATNNDGFFSFEANLMPDMKIIISFIGYEKTTIRANECQVLSPSDDPSSFQLSPFTFVLKEQPIALQETVVAAKPSKQKNKRKQMAALLHAVYVKLEEEFPDNNAQYQVVSDVRMDGATDRALEAKNSENSTWGMEQMIANIVVLPEQAMEGRDSVQFQGRYCKRFFDAEKRAQADSILAGDAIERLEKKQKEKFMRKAANAVDSGVVVHRALFAMGNMRYDFEQTMTDTRHWTVSNESEGETVLTHTQKVSKYLGLFQMTFQRHYIVDSETFAVRRFSEHAEVKVTIPFGIKLNAEQLQMLNLVNMSEQNIEKFRLKKLRGSVDLNTIYQRQDGHVYLLEKNMISNIRILGSKKAEIPLVVKATQRVTSLQTQGVTPLSPSQITRRLKREIVEIY
ncbi:MAG: carboxypeptidase-like regulatory domain-containing protein [Paludibacteraceae bacterium]|nr:carboxypeptidase-like regulatory domain-containing protein [Paludibacteraceae bacterium]